MKKLFSVLTVLLGTALLALSFTVAAQDKAVEKSLADQLRAGGHVIVFRHGATHADQADTEPLNPAAVDKQRQLNDKGKAAAKMAGEAFKTIGVPVGNVYTSKFYRAVETAQIAAFGKSEAMIDLTEGGLVVSPNENNRRAAAFRKLAGTAPEAGKNTVIVSHKPNIMDAFGKDWFEVKEGEASIFKPDGAGTYKLVARVQMDEWAKVAAK